MTLVLHNTGLRAKRVDPWNQINVSGRGKISVVTEASREKQSPAIKSANENESASQRLSPVD